MRLQLTDGYIGQDYPQTFFRVEDYMTGRLIADFSAIDEARRFAINDAAASGRRYDHRVRTMRRS